MLFSYIFAIFAPFNRIIMSEKFPYGYDVNAYIDKVFERMKKFRIALVMTLALFIASWPRPSRAVSPWINFGVVWLVSQ